MQHLQPNTYLQGGKYKIIEKIGQGGFGITYLAENTMLDGKVVIKEFFFKGLCERDSETTLVTKVASDNCIIVNHFKQKFIKEARTIFKLRHSNIVQIHDIFEENGTAYYVMDYITGGSLSAKVKAVGYLSEQMAIRYVLQVAEALEYVHLQKMNHLDVKPANIMLNEKGEAVLIDFGLSKQYDEVSEQTKSNTAVCYSEGFSPLEQYDGSVKEFSPEIDIYSLGATLFNLLTGVTPPSASFVNNNGLPIDELNNKGVDVELIGLIGKMMEPRKTDRISDIHVVIEQLRKIKNKVLDGKSQPKQQTEGRKNIKWLTVIAIAAVCIIAVWCISFFINKDYSADSVVESTISITLHDGTMVTWTGPLKDNVPDGKGTVVYPANDRDGRSRYEGVLVNGKRHDSKATLYYNNGDTYTGSFANDCFDKGRLVHVEDGLYYEGSFYGNETYDGEWRFSSDNSIYSIVKKGKEQVQ